MKKYISHIETLKTQLKEWGLVHIPRENNEMADVLAKAGVFRGNDLLVFYGQNPRPWGIRLRCSPWVVVAFICELMLLGVVWLWWCAVALYIRKGNN